MDKIQLDKYLQTLVKVKKIDIESYNKIDADRTTNNLIGFCRNLWLSIGRKNLPRRLRKITFIMNKSHTIEQTCKCFKICVTEVEKLCQSLKKLRY